MRRSLPALKLLASGHDASAEEIANMAIVEKLMDDYAETRLADPNDPSNDPDLAARRAKALDEFLTDLQAEHQTSGDTHVAKANLKPSDHRP